MVFPAGQVGLSRFPLEGSCELEGFCALEGFCELEGFCGLEDSCEPHPFGKLPHFPLHSLYGAEHTHSVGFVAGEGT